MGWGVRLGGRTVYPYAVQHRPVLGDGRPVGVADIARARALARRVDLAAVLVCAGIAAARARRASSA